MLSEYRFADYQRKLGGKSYGHQQVAVVVLGGRMKICYVDESGDVAPIPTPVSPIQPAFVIAGIILDHRDVPAVTEDFISLKREMFPAARRRTYMNSILWEVKGSEIRKHATSRSRNKRRHAFRYLDRSLGILESYNAKVIGRSWVKGVGNTFDGRAVYTFSVQSMFESFQNYLTSIDDVGVLIADNRTHSLNRNVSHSIFTQKFKRTGDDFDRIVDLPTFAISDNVAALQLCDTLCSSFLFPLSVFAYCTGHVQNLHVRPGYSQIRDRFGDRLRALQHRYQDSDGRWRGGITVSDGIAQRSGGILFR